MTQIIRNSRKATNLASTFNLARTAIFTFMIPDEHVTKITIFIPILSKSFLNFKVQKL